MKLPAEKKIHEPEGGWAPSSWYVVEVAYTASNPIHRTLFYSGFLTDGKPGAYNQLIHPSYDDENKASDAYYLKPVRCLSINSNHANMNVVDDVVHKAEGLVLLLRVIKDDLPAEIIEAMAQVMESCSKYNIEGNDENR